MKERVFRRIGVLFALLIPLWLVSAPWVDGEEKDTFSISLVQRATVKKTGGREVVYERYQVEKGDYIWKIMRQRGLLKKPDFTELYAALKNLNPSLTNLDLIHPGETILIPLNIVSVKGYEEGKELDQEPAKELIDLDEADLENYVVKPGDSLTKIIKNKFNLPSGFVYEDYLKLVQKFNPALTNPDLIFPNQVIRLPIYSPEMVRMPIKAQPETAAPSKPRPAKTKDTAEILTLKQGLKSIFNQMGEEWVDGGEQFIPLKSGGQVNLKADSFPVLNLNSGRRIIVDIRNELPEDIGRLIEADWEDYRIVHLAQDDSLKTATGKILSACNYHTVVKSGDYLKVTGDVGITIAGDWAIIPQKGKGDIPDRVITLSFIRSRSEQTPRVVKAYLARLGIIAVDYPDFSGSDSASEEVPVLKEITMKENVDFPLTTLLLDLAGQPFSKTLEIPLYRGEDSGFNVIIKADIFFNRQGQDCIIDFRGLSPHIVSLLSKHRIRVLPLSRERVPSRITARVLDFLGIPFASKEHRFPVAARPETRNIMISFSGITFADREGQMILATDKRIAEELVFFLNKSGYHVLDLTRFGQ
ncbi:MAG TPA: LysM peptidoglycan-binding domain-containing protein [Desulfatiglandales bacterium]|nr:LysM peptidoglycan-binding domain-containing protein [Desulfatiglandales bacterium]